MKLVVFLALPISQLLTQNTIYGLSNFGKGRFGGEVYEREDSIFQLARLLGEYDQDWQGRRDLRAH